jgi:deoxyribodipyrimidine photo-lyase
MSNGHRNLVWFRRDLRVRDNHALHHAAMAASRGVVAVFVISPAEWRAHDDAPVKIDFWLRNLRELSAELAALNIPLVIVVAAKTNQIGTALLEVAKRTRCNALYYNHEYEVNEQARDRAVAAHFKAHGLASTGFHDHVVFDPSTIRTGTGGYYGVYTPFKKAFIKRAEADGFKVLPMPRKQPEMPCEPSAVPATVPGFESRVDPAHWPAGERFALDHLARFCEHRIAAYKEARDTPAIDGTSRLSAYLNSGVVSPRQCIARAMEANAARLDDTKGGSPGPAHWISEVIWREFYQHVIHGHPRICMGRAFRPATDRIVWDDNPGFFERWCQGRTGVPIVDAAMRQLAELGWMHNRLRMIVAMYLSKDLFLNWRLGEKFFMQRLIDGDLGSNNGGWQWSASTGTDSAPYFRIFNPASQSERCDPDGAFIRRWVPELAGVQGEAIHDPSRLPGLLRGKLDYPEPLVDRTKTKDRVIAAFRGLDERVQDA